jgi:hypothetical protein
VYGVLLRLDAYTDKYGPLPSPAWARVATTTLADAGDRLKPFDRAWSREEVPYAGGDPINYLRFARDMKSFYQAHVREPVFLAITRLYLWLLNGQDAAVSFASLTGSVLIVIGTYLLAAMFMPRPAALAAALVIAVDYEVITWSVDGWRDDVFTAGVVWSAWACARLRAAPMVQNAMLLGVCGAFASLTRITAVTFLLPALAWLAIDTDRGLRRIRLRHSVIALAVMTLLVAPYLISCAIETGDPLYAINYHTVYYRHGEGMPTDQSMSAADYIAVKFGSYPLRTIDTGVTGLFVQPFVSKWGGLDPILGSLRQVLIWSSLAGLLLLVWTAAGRLLIVILFSSLLPYAFTWNIGDGAAWRFTMHAYPFFVVAACHALATAVRWLAALFRGPRTIARPSRRAIVVGIAVAALVIALPLAYAAMPWLVVREAIAKGEDVSIETGGRDGAFYTHGWSPVRQESIFIRVSQGDRSVVRVPLPSRRDYDLVLRVDPVLPDMQQRLNVLFNGRFVARFNLTANPERVGSYRLRVTPDQVREGRNDLTLLPEVLVPAASAGPRFSWLPPEARIGIRLWYVRVLSEI